ncbi:MAG: ribonuclease HII [Campylobacterota bacterium]|nr:ribonuclease HII [Campylobacterota bacterium]
MNKKNLCGIDEAGRGCIAGSLVVTGLVLHKRVDGLRDSKKLNERRREELYDVILQNSTSKSVIYSAVEIDEIGLSKAISLALEKIKEALHVDEYLFDGNSTFGVLGITTMVKADDKVDEVRAASIVAKVTRDRLMIEASKVYPQYKFEKHKGYGTALHVELIKEHGYCVEHRRTFKLKALEGTLF